MSGGELAEPAGADGKLSAESLPETVRQRFAGYAERDLRAPAYRDFLAARLMEEGRGEELRWLARTVGRDALASLLERRGGRALSRRSRAFWERVLGVPSEPPHPLAHELWPLA